MSALERLQEFPVPRRDGLLAAVRSPALPRRGSMELQKELEQFRQEAQRLKDGPWGTVTLPKSQD
jgi:hypothetical protein